MIQQDHLKIYTLTLTTRAPLYVGNGQSYTKTDYLFSHRNGLVSIVDSNRLFEYLLVKGHADQYERFIMGGGTDLRSFLLDTCGADRSDVDSLILYSVDATSALDEHHSLKEIHAFSRNSAKQAFIPGSSLKGALRTVLLFDLLQQDENKGNLQLDERKYLNTLSCKKDREGNVAKNAVNSIMRGIQVSDSVPIPNNAMTLCAKLDANVYGEVHRLNLCRECVAPGVEITFYLTLDQSILKDRITPEYILDCIDRFDDYYWDTYVKMFDQVKQDSGENYDRCLILGGGSGFFAKSLAYPFYGEDEALRRVSENMSRSFKRHKHEKDPELGISPHTMKYAEYQGKRYPFGVCGVEIS